jgi:UDP-MurNAc hydroxylase
LKITFVNHASFLLESEAANLVCDPWLTGKVFNDGWALVSPSFQLPCESLEYIWISHEHPDHFNFPTLRTIPDAEKKRIEILYQKHSSPRIADALRKMGFTRVRELPLYKWVKVKPGFEVLCGSVGSMDSFLAIRTENETVLNMNDCVCNAKQLAYIRRLVGKVSVLFTQFSFANWIGNGKDEIGAVKAKLDEFTSQIKTFKPEFTIPFASFIFFCNQENAWMNEFAVLPDRIQRLGLESVHFMYPGDQWDSRTRKFTSDDAVSKYLRDWEAVHVEPTPPAVSSDKIQPAVVRLLQELKNKYGKSLMKRLKPFDIFVHDLNQTASIRPEQLQCEIKLATPETASAARYKMCSQVAWYSFAHNWGWGTLQVSGMFFDREFEKKGADWLLARSVNALSTDLWNFTSVKRAKRTVRFFWAKKFELLYRFLSRRSANAMGD